MRVRNNNYKEVGSIFQGFIIVINLILIPYLVGTTGLLLINQLVLVAKNTTKIGKLTVS